MMNELNELNIFVEWKRIKYVKYNNKKKLKFKYLKYCVWGYEVYGETKSEAHHEVNKMSVVDTIKLYYQAKLHTPAKVHEERE